MTFGFRINSIAALIAGLFVLASPATASTVALDIQGPQDGYESLGPDTLPVAASDGAAATFSLNADLTNAAFSFDLFCFTPTGCSGLAYLTQSPVGPTGSIAGLKAVSAIVGTG
ncbi:hypothetical protein HA397_24135, partial [Escherichia coli]|nr:hypothetical protein [Escherichia coli]